MKWNNNDIDKTCGFGIHRLTSTDNLFHTIYIIDNITGALFVSSKYSDKLNISETPEDLISSFLNAMNLFINETFHREEEIQDEVQEVNFNRMRILYEKRERLMVIAISKKTNLETEKYFVHEILNDFYTRFENKISQFNGIIDPAMQNYKNRLKNFDLSLSWAKRNSIIF